MSLRMLKRVMLKDNNLKKTIHMNLVYMRPTRFSYDAFIRDLEFRLLCLSTEILDAARLSYLFILFRTKLGGTFL